jgi:hypothetical protein
MVDCGQVGPGQDAAARPGCGGSAGPHRGVGAGTRAGRGGTATRGGALDVAAGARVEVVRVALEYSSTGAGAGSLFDEMPQRDALS